nr:uncharacterized protein LOC111511916 [Leptinotarsa decemlineata]
MTDFLEYEVKLCIESSLQNENFTEFKIDFVGTTGKTEGYLADIVYAKVTGSDRYNKSKQVDLFIKLGKRNKELRKNMPIMKNINEREIYFYSEVLPAFEKFLEPRETSIEFDIFPKCYTTFLSNEMEMLILEDLRRKGYTLPAGIDAMNLKHLHLVLKTYAKIHALSFALRDQNRSAFEKLADEYLPINQEFNMCMRSFRNCGTRCKKTLADVGRVDLCEKFDAIFKNYAEFEVEEILKDVPKEAVIIHCDSHINNFLFLYENGNAENPTEVAIIDWQLSELHSPILDVSFFLLSGIPLENLPQLNELLRYYHSQLETCLRDLGSNINKIFPFHRLLDHWKRYSNYGFFWAITYTKFFFCDVEDAPSFEDVKKGYDLSDLISDMKVNNLEAYSERIVEITDHHFKYLQFLDLNRA